MQVVQQLHRLSQRHPLSLPHASNSAPEPLAHFCPHPCRRVPESVGQRFLNLRTMSGGVGGHACGELACLYSCLTVSELGGCHLLLPAPAHLPSCPFPRPTAEYTALLGELHNIHTKPGKLLLLHVRFRTLLCACPASRSHPRQPACAHSLLIPSLALQVCG